MNLRAALKKPKSIVVSSGMAPVKNVTVDTAGMLMFGSRSTGSWLNETSPKTRIVMANKKVETG